MRHAWTCALRLPLPPAAILPRLSAFGSRLRSPPLWRAGMLPVTLPRAQILELLKDAEELKQIEVDLRSQADTCVYIYV